MSINVTETAKVQMSNLLTKNPEQDAVRLSVLGGGCAGFKYDWGFAKDSEINKDDVVVKWDNG